MTGWEPPQGQTGSIPQGGWQPEAGQQPPAGQAPQAGWSAPPGAQPPYGNPPSTPYFAPGGPPGSPANKRSKKGLVIGVLVGVVVIVAAGVIIPLVLGAENAGLVSPPDANTPEWVGPGFEVAFPITPSHSTQTNSGTTIDIWQEGDIDQTHATYFVFKVPLTNSVPNSEENATTLAQGAAQGITGASGAQGATTASSPTPISLGSLKAAWISVNGPAKALAQGAGGLQLALAGMSSSTPMTLALVVAPENNVAWFVGALGVGSDSHQLPGISAFVTSFKATS